VRERAAQQIFQRYFRKLVTLALRKLHPQVRPRVDGEDVAQSALGSFFRCERKERYVLECKDNLEKLLVAITLNKARKVARTFFSKGRDIGREERATPSGASDESMYPEWLFAYMDKSQPSPDEAAALSEVIKSLPDKLREVVELKLQGYQDKEIAEQLGLSPETIRLRKRRIEHEARALFEGSVGPGE
jgi:RNA polymerase sigma factor (sigma-70 family)